MPRARDFSRKAFPVEATVHPPHHKTSKFRCVDLTIRFTDLDEEAREKLLEVVSVIDPISISIHKPRSFFIPSRFAIPVHFKGESES